MTTSFILSNIWQLWHFNLILKTAVKIQDQVTGLRSLGTTLSCCNNNLGWSVLHSHTLINNILGLYEFQHTLYIIRSTSISTYSLFIYLPRRAVGVLAFGHFLLFYCIDNRYWICDLRYHTFQMVACNEYIQTNMSS